MRTSLKQGIFCFLVLVCVAPYLHAADSILRGTVTDGAGKPIRAAIVEASSGNKTVSRYTQEDGRYSLTLPAGTYKIAVTAYGYTPKNQTKNTSDGGDVDFKLASKLDVMRLSSADLETLLPENRETRLIREECVSCHNLSNVIKHRGATAEEWREFLPNMTGRYRGLSDESPMWSPGVFAAVTDALEKYFGPGSEVFSPEAASPSAETIKHPQVSVAALNATYREYVIPGDNVMAHSIAVSPDGAIAWFSEGSINKIGRFNIEQESFQNYDIPEPGYAPHTPTVGPDGRAWITLAGHSPVKLVSIDPETGAVKGYRWPEQPYPAHTPTLDKSGNLWLSNFAPGEVWRFDTKAEKFQSYKFVMPAENPEGSTGALELTFGPPAKNDRYTSLATSTVNDWPYHIVSDSKGRLWFGSLFLGTITSFNPATGETKRYKPEGAPSTRGIALDAQDNIWFSNFHGHRLGKIDTKTGAIKQYEYPTRNATGYGIVIDKKTGFLWIADMNGNNITRFDPKTEQFVEYPVPTHQAIPRFISLDNKGRIWFTELFGHKIGVLDPNGDSKESSARQISQR